MDDPNKTIPVSSVPVVILAGGKAKPELEAVIGTSVRALAVVFGKTLLDHILDAAKSAAYVGPITVVGNVPASPCYQSIPDGGDFVTNILAGVETCKNEKYVLVTTSDLPYITEFTVQSFLTEAIALADATGAQMIYPIVEVAAVTPGSPASNEPPANSKRVHLPAAT